MPPSDVHDQLTTYLADVHALERQALVKLRAAPAMARDPDLAAALGRHLAETADHERLVRERLRARGASPVTVTIKDLASAATGKGYVLFLRTFPDTPGKLMVHEFAYEHMEVAAYDLLERLAELAGDEETAEVARVIREQEAAMIDRLQDLFSSAAEAALLVRAPKDLPAQLDRYLADAHAIEVESAQLLRRSLAVGGAAELVAEYEHHLSETGEQRRLVEQRLAARGSRPSRVKDAALRLGALWWAWFFQVQPDTPAKLAAFAFGIEHFEAASYEMLAAVARRAGDTETAEVAARIAGEERAAAARLRALLGAGLHASLREVGVAA
jgi:ferritin-like metal-binding protein YciE